MHTCGGLSEVTRQSFYSKPLLSKGSINTYFYPSNHRYCIPFPSFPNETCMYFLFSFQITELSAQVSQQRPNDYIRHQLPGVSSTAFTGQKNRSIFSLLQISDKRMSFATCQESQIWTTLDQSRKQIPEYFRLLIKDTLSAPSE